MVVVKKCLFAPKTRVQNSDTVFSDVILQIKQWTRIKVMMFRVTCVVR
jgi:hypothetical protein